MNQIHLYGNKVIMQMKVFIAFKNLSQQEKGLKKITYEGKDYYGVFAPTETISLQELRTTAETFAQDPNQLTLIPLAVFG